MSLILDAQRRADSQREREGGAVPGLHAQQVAVAPLPRQAAMPPWLWVVAVAVAGLLVGLGVWLVARGGPAQRIAAPAVAQPAAMAPAGARHRGGRGVTAARRVAISGAAPSARR